MDARQHAHRRMTTFTQAMGVWCSQPVLYEEVAHRAARVCEKVERRAYSGGTGF